MKRDKTGREFPSIVKHDEKTRVLRGTQASLVKPVTPKFSSDEPS